MRMTKKSTLDTVMLADLTTPEQPPKGGKEEATGNTISRCVVLMSLEINSQGHTLLQTTRVSQIPLNNMKGTSNSKTV